MHYIIGNKISKRTRCCSWLKYKTLKESINFVDRIIFFLKWEIILNIAD